MIRTAVILAGGAGTRLWPASNRKHPKQFLVLPDGGTLLQRTVNRAAAAGARRVVIVTHRDQAESVVADVETNPGVPSGCSIEVLCEPDARNTAPAIAFALAYLRNILARDETTEETLLVMPADHVIQPESSFVEDVNRAASIAKIGKIVTFGVVPTRPETGYGYIEAGPRESSGYLVRSFREKPDADTARSYLSAGHYYWNSGMFTFLLETALKALETHAPAVYAAFDNIAEAYVTDARLSNDRVRVMEPMRSVIRAYKDTPSVSFDFAVMERSDRTAMVDATFRWSDVGSWDEFSALPVPPEQGDSARVVTVDSENCYVYSDLPVALCNVEDLHVVVKNGVVLVCRRGTSQNVKRVVETLRERNRTELL